MDRMRAVAKLKASVSRPRPTQLFSTKVLNRKQLNTREELDEFLSKPTWSVRSLLPTEEQIEQSKEVTTKQLAHLLRLSALPEPSSPEEEAKMLKDLRSQLHFVKEIQRVDTEGVKPLRSLHDETPSADAANEITVESLKDDLAQEEIVGKHHKRIRRRKDIHVDAQDVENWDVLGQAPNKVGKYFVVHGKEN